LYEIIIYYICFNKHYDITLIIIVIENKVLYFMNSSNLNMNTLNKKCNVSQNKVSINTTMIYIIMHILQ